MMCAAILVIWAALSLAVLLVCSVVCTHGDDNIAEQEADGWSS
jgi:hypothetical protein